MTPQEENRLLGVAADTLDTAAAQLQSLATRTTSGHLHQELAGIEREVRHAMAAVRDIRTARRGPA